MEIDPAEYLDEDELLAYLEEQGAQLGHAGDEPEDVTEDLPEDEELRRAILASQAQLQIDEEERRRIEEAEARAQADVAEMERDIVEEGQQPLSEEERNRLLQDYREYWNKAFGLAPAATEIQKIQRERQIRALAGLPPAKARDQPLTEEELRRLQRQIQAKRAAELEAKLQNLPPVEANETARRRLQRAVRTYLSSPCENRQELEDRYIHPAQIVKLRLLLPDNSVRMVCYDVIELYPYLLNNFAREQEWKDPKYNVILNRMQREVIKQKWNNRSSCAKGEPHFSQLMVSLADDEKIRVPLALYDRGTHAPGSLYVIFRVYLPEKNIYTYIHADGHTNEVDIDGERVRIDDADPNVIKLPLAVMETLGLDEGSVILVEDCFDLNRITRIVLQPVEAKWYQLPETATEDIVNFLTTALENLYTIQLGQTIPVDYGGEIYNLIVADLFSGVPERRVPVAVTKQTTANVEILPIQPLTRVVLQPLDEEWYQAPEQYLNAMLRSLVARLQKYDFVSLGDEFALAYGPKTYKLKIVELLAKGRMVLFGLIKPGTSIEIAQRA